jgi:MFS family permease
MSSTMVAPALDTISVEFKLRSKVEEFMVMSIFLLAIAIGPFLWGPLCDILGRVRVIQGGNLIFLLFTTLCGFARSEQQIMAFRFFAGIGASAPQAVSVWVNRSVFHMGTY